MSVRAQIIATFLTIAATGVRAHAQPAVSYSPRFERPIVTAGAGVRRLAVDLPLLIGAAPFDDVRRTGGPRIVPPRAYGGLSDLRLFAHDGREIGYLLVYSRQTPPMTVALAFDRRPGEPGQSRYRVRLPHARLPVVALALDVDGAHVFRSAVVTEARFAGSEVAPIEIGRATLSRSAAQEAAAGTLRIPIVPPRESEIDLVVDDGNNPPLDLKAIAAVFADLPWIYFEAPGTAVVARYGDARAVAPMYDLEAARGSVRIDEVPQASWGEPRALTEPATRVTEGSPIELGPPIDSGAFRVQRALTDTSPGLAALALDAAVLAHSRGPDARFADVRIVDAGGRQIPYLLERRSEPLALDLELKPFEPAVRELRSGPPGRRSVYSFGLPYRHLPPVRLVLETSARVFQRSVEVGVERPPDRQHRDRWFDVLASSGWQHADQSAPAPALTLSIQPSTDSTIVVVVHEGDNRQLPIVVARALLPLYRLRFYHPGGRLRLLYGHDDLSIPQYDLALLGGEVMGTAAGEVHAEPWREAAAPKPASQLISPRTFWIGLGVMVVVLVALVARLMRS